MADSINKKYNVTATILTPLHIGAGAEKDWAKGMDYIEKDGVMYHLDVNRMFAADVDMDKLAAAFATGRTQDVERIIGGRLEQCSDFQMLMPVSSSNPIKVFLRNQLTGKPVLAGSSLKGAIRSILFTYLRERNQTQNEEVFGRLKDGKDFMRFIRVGDIEFSKSATELVNTKIYNLQGGQGHWIGGWKHKPNETNAYFDEIGFNTIYECLSVNEKAVGNISIAETLFDNFVKETIVANPKKSKIIHSQITDICAIINAHTRRYLEKEMQFFKKFNEGGNSNYLTAEEKDFSGGITLLFGELDNLQSNECLLKMSAGAGFHSVTGDWQFGDYTNGKFDRKSNKKEQHILPKSRKIAISKVDEDLFLDLMGFVKLTFEPTE